jgi:hypothetical protein
MMNNSLPAAGTQGPFFTQWITGGRLVALNAVAMSFWAVIHITLYDGDSDYIRLMISLTARV